jgi:LacI family transcriptional regulator
MNKKTIYDVAKDLHLAPSTISKALNNNGSISDITRKKILEYVKETGYVTATNARILKAKFSWTIGVVFSEEMNIGLEHQFFSSVLQNFKNYVEKRGYELSFIVQQLGNNKMSYLDWCHNKKVDGVLIVAGNINDKGLVELVQSEIKCVSTDLVFNELHNIRSDNYQGVELAINYLVENNHKKIAVVNGPESSYSFKERLLAYYDVLKKKNLQIRDEYVSHSLGFGYTSGYNAARAMLENLVDFPTAIIVASDDIAFGVIRGVESFGYKVPEDISVIGFDDISTSRLFTPALTTIKQNRQEIGEKAGEILIGLISEKKDEYNYQTKIPVELVIRDSVSKAK